MTTIGDLTTNAIGRDRLIIQHEGSTVSGLLTDLDITTDSAVVISNEVVRHDVDVEVTLTLGSITIGPLHRDHPCEVIA